jgi:hypothetical protein
MNYDSDGDSYTDWLADFAASPKSDAELRTWRESLVGNEQAELRQLIAEAQCMRWTARLLLQRLRDIGDWPLREGQTDEPVRLAAWLLEVREPHRTAG